jgi:hypothetical protein
MFGHAKDLGGPRNSYNGQTLRDRFAGDFIRHWMLGNVLSSCVVNGHRAANSKEGL